MAQVLRSRKLFFLGGTVFASLMMLIGLCAFSSVPNTFARERTLFVGLSAGHNSSCASPGYTSVQAAVDVAQVGDTVYLCGAHTYSEQVIINKSLTLTGDRGATIQAPSSFPATALSRLPAQFTTDNLFVPQAVVVVWGTQVRVTLSRLIVAGTLPGNGGCAENEFGVLVIAGATVDMSADQVQDIRDANTSLAGCQFGVAIQIGREYWPTADFSTDVVENFVGHANISFTTVTRYQKNGITIDGPGSTATVVDSTVKGFGRDAVYGPIIAQNGIQVSRGAGGDISNNAITGNSYTGSAPDASSTGVLIFGGCGDPLVTNVEVAGNTLLNNDLGIALNNYTADCSAPASTPTRDKAFGNFVSDNAVTNQSAETFNTVNYSGYQAGIDDVGNTDQITYNIIAGVGYAPQNTPNGVYVQPIDVTSFPTINPIMNHNALFV